MDTDRAICLKEEEWIARRNGTRCVLYSALFSVRMLGFVHQIKRYAVRTLPGYTTIPHHPGDLPEGILRAILRQAGVSPDAFLQVR